MSARNINEMVLIVTIIYSYVFYIYYNI